MIDALDTVWQLGLIGGSGGCVIEGMSVFGRVPTVVKGATTWIGRGIWILWTDAGIINSSPSQFLVPFLGQGR